MIENKEKSVFVVIDIIKDLVNADGKLAAMGIASHAVSQNLITNTKYFLDYARSNGIKVIHVKVNYEKGYPEIKNSKMPMYQGMEQMNVLIKGDPGAEIVDELKPLDGEAVLIKSRINPFTNHEFHKVLIENKIDTIILAGVATNFAVEEAARTAAQADYRVIVLKDCCASMNKEMHDFAINVILPNFATVTSSKELVG